VVLGNDVEGSLDVPDQHVPVADVDPELVLEGLMNVDTGFDVQETALVSPVRVEGDGHSLSQLRRTFHRSGSTWLSLLWTHLMMRLAVRPGCVKRRVRDGGFRCAWEAEYR
jgi:hypothetical protein